jgi:hypothetical protein
MTLPTAQRAAARRATVTRQQHWVPADRLARIARTADPARLHLRSAQHLADAIVQRLSCCDVSTEVQAASYCRGLIPICALLASLERWRAAAQCLGCCS